MWFITSLDEGGNPVPEDGNAHIMQATSEDGVTWLLDGVALSPGPEWASIHLFNCSVLKHGQTYMMWVVGYNGGTSLGLATSPDGYQWTWHSGNPISIAPLDGSLLLGVGSVLYNHQQTRFEMWFVQGDAWWSPFAVGFATSQDGATWTRHPSPVFTAGTSDLFDENSLSVIRNGDLYELYYGSSTNDIRMATSSDGVSWTDATACGPVLGPSPGAWDGQLVRWPSAVMTATGRRVLYYTGDAGTPTLGAIGRAVEVTSGACCGSGTCREVPAVTAGALQPGDACAAYVCNHHELLVGPLYENYQGCFGDIDGNGVVNAADRGAVSANMGATDPILVCHADMDGNGVVNAADRGFVSANIGQCHDLPPYMSGGTDTRFPGTFRGQSTTCQADCP
jgi:hypothetical protein